MKITIEHHQDQFNVALSSQEGRDPFITIKGCRLANGKNGEFVSWPATKRDNGKWWNHVYASEDFGKAVLAEVKKSKPAESRPQRQTADEDIPF